MLGLWYL